MTNINLYWGKFKTVVDNRNLPIQWIDDGEKYHLYVLDGLLIVNCFLFKNGDADVLEFEANYKSPGNAAIKFNVRLKDANNNDITSTQISSQRAMDVNVINPSGIAVFPDRLSKAPGRTYVTASLENVTSTTTVRTVTAAKIFYMTSYTISCQNVSLLAIGRVVIRDNATNKIPFLVAQSVVGLVSPNFTQALSMELNPMPFTTNVSLAILSGTLGASISVSGYEE